MPCAAGELCQIREKTPEPPDGRGCYGGCGGRLHGIYGEVDQEGDSELRRICPKCASKQPAKYASGCGLTETSYFFKKVRMVMIEAHASKPARQLTLGSFFKRGKYGFGSGSLTVWPSALACTCRRNA